jgi:hypothetical protein
MVLHECTVYIRGLEKGTTATQLAEKFSDVGSVVKSALCLTSDGGFTGRAYVTFPSKEIAEQAAFKHSKDGVTVQAVGDVQMAEMELLLGESQQEQFLGLFQSLSESMQSTLRSQMMNAAVESELSLDIKQEEGAMSHPPSSVATAPTPTATQVHASPPYGIVVQEPPKICVFSGMPGKDSSFGKWKYDVMCVKEEFEEGKHTLSTALSAMRKSLRSPASDIITHLGKEADLDTIVAKLKSVYGTVFSGQTLLQRFYAGAQKEESCAQWACRLECLAYDAEEKKMVTRTAVPGMLKAQFWAGLRDRRIKNALRHRKDEIGFEELVVEAREIEEEYKSESEESDSNKVKAKAKVQQTKPTQMEELLQHMKEMSMRMEKFEGQLKRQQSSQPKPRTREGPAKCDKCQMEGHLSFGCRQGTDVTCYQCGQRGHISRSCRSSSKPLNCQ